MRLTVVRLSRLHDTCRCACSAYDVTCVCSPLRGLLSPRCTQVREFVSLLGLMTSCVAGRALLRAVSRDPSANVATLLKPIATAATPTPGDSSSPAMATPLFTGTPSPAQPPRGDDTSADAITALLPICGSAAQDFITRQLVLSLGVSECQSSEGFLRHVVFSPDSTPSLKYVVAMTFVVHRCCFVALAAPSRSFTRTRWVVLFRLYTVHALRAMLRRGSIGFSDWGVDMLVTIVLNTAAIAFDLDVRGAALSVLTEACSYSVYAGFTVVALRRRLAACGKGPASTTKPCCACATPLVWGVAYTSIDLCVCGVCVPWFFVGLPGLMPLLSALPQCNVDSLLVALSGVREGLELLETCDGALDVLVQRWLARDAAVHTVDVCTRISVALIASPSTAIPTATPGVAPASGNSSGPAVIPITVPSELLGGSVEASSYSLDSILRMPWRVEVWADYETEAQAPAILTNVSVKAGKMLGLTPLSPRSRTGSIGAGNSPAVGSAGTASYFDAPTSPRPASAAMASSFGSFSESDRPDVTKHSIPIRCDAIVDLSSIRCGTAALARDMHPSLCDGPVVIRCR
jgi:hypothetical protein